MARDRRGGPVGLRVPQRGDKKTLPETVARNAMRVAHPAQAAPGQRPDHPEPSPGGGPGRARLDEAPLRIECYDVSNLQGTHVVASMVVFEDGLARKAEYRRFTITVDGTDDISAIREVITRRFRRYLAEREETGELDMLGDAELEELSEREHNHSDERPVVSAKPKFAYPPNLVVVDGAAGQVAAAARPPWPSSASTTWRCAAWPSGSRRCGCQARSTRSSFRAPRRGSTCYNGCGTRRTGSPSPTIGPNAAKAATVSARSTRCLASARPGGRRC